MHSKGCRVNPTQAFAINGVVLSIKSFWEHMFESPRLATKMMIESYPVICYEYEFSYAQKMAL